MKMLTVCLSLALLGSGCAPFADSAATYAKLSPEDRQQIDDIGPAVMEAVSTAISGNLPGAVAAGVKAGNEMSEAAAVKNPDTGLPIGWKDAIYAAVFAILMKGRHKLFGSDPTVAKKA